MRGLRAGKRMRVKEKMKVFRGLEISERNMESLMRDKTDMQNMDTFTDSFTSRSPAPTTQSGRFKSVEAHLYVPSLLLIPVVSLSFSISLPLGSKMQRHND